MTLFRAIRVHFAHPARWEEDAPVPPTLELLLADELNSRGSSFAKLVLDLIEAEVPEMVEGAERRSMALAAADSLLADFATALRLGAGPERFHAPAGALAFAIQLAREGVPLASVLRTYRLGQELVFARAAELAEQLPDPDERLRATARIGLLGYRFADGAMSDVAHEYEAAREAFIRGSLARRHAVVRELLAGRPVDLAEAERTLGHRLDGCHRAFVAWPADGDLDEEALTAAVRPLAPALGQGRPLIVADRSGEISVWVACSDAARAALDAALAALDSARVRAAVGEPGEGVEGFVASKRQADLARSVARLGAEGPVSWYADVALAAVLLRDLETARRFAAEELGELARPGRAAADLRATLSAYFAAGHDQSRAAYVLGVHRNTVAKRLRRAEALIGHPLTERLRELEAALVIASAASEGS